MNTTTEKKKESLIGIGFEPRAYALHSTAELKGKGLVH